MHESNAGLAGKLGGERRVTVTVDSHMIAQQDDIYSFPSELKKDSISFYERVCLTPFEILSTLGMNKQRNEDSRLADISPQAVQLPTAHDSFPGFASAALDR